MKNKFRMERINLIISTFLSGNDLELARFATVLVSNASQFTSVVQLQYDNSLIEIQNSPECIMKIMNLNIQPLEIFELRAEGTDEKEVLSRLKIRLKEFTTQE